MARRPSKSPLRRTLDLCVFAPIGVAVTVVEDLPGLIAKGRRLVEQELGNAAGGGAFVVGHKGQREVSDRLDGPAGQRRRATPVPEGPGRRPSPRRRRPCAPRRTAAGRGDRRRALADYDTLSASQVVRRLESLGPEELRAVQRYESSTRNRRTILNRASQLLDERPAAPPDC